MPRTLIFMQENMEFIKPNLWIDNAYDPVTYRVYRVKYIRHIYKEDPWMNIEIIEYWLA